MHSLDAWGPSHIISSEARFRILQVLLPLQGRMGLRELERATHLNIRSVQVATEGLVSEKILKKDRNGHFGLNEKSELACFVKKFILFLRDEQLRERAKHFSDRAKQVIRLSDQVADFVKIGKINS